MKLGEDLLTPTLYHYSDLHWAIAWHHKGVP